jgi:uncharacterized protein GlcG (DUF336 family)
MDKGHQPPMIVFGGGQPIERDGQIIGAVGVAGGMVPDDEAVAAAVAQALGRA